MPSGLTMLFLGAYAGRRRDWNPLVSHSGGATGPVPVGSWNAGTLESWEAGRVPHRQNSTVPDSQVPGPTILQPDPKPGMAHEQVSISNMAHSMSPGGARLVAVGTRHGRGQGPGSPAGAPGAWLVSRLGSEKNASTQSKPARLSDLEARGDAVMLKGS